eukprot:2993976-Lingulodinium_polyedra.AAC.1
MPGADDVLVADLCAPEPNGSLPEGVSFETPAVPRHLPRGTARLACHHCLGKHAEVSTVAAVKALL